MVTAQSTNSHRSPVIIRYLIFSSFQMLLSGARRRFVGSTCATILQIT